MVASSTVLAISLPCNIDESVVVEVTVLEQGLDKTARPVTRDSDVCVVAIVNQIRRDKGPLWKLLIFEVFVEPAYDLVEWKH